MKRMLFLIVVLVLVITAAQPVSVVHAAPDPKTIRLDVLQFIPGKGWVAVFSYTGEWKRGDLKGQTLSVDGQSFDLYCNIRDDSHIACTMGSLELHIGQLARIFFAGQVFSAIVPEKREAGFPFAECPSDGYEGILIAAHTSTGDIIHGALIYYPAAMYTIEDAVANWIHDIENSLEVTIVSYEITDVVCGQGT